MEMLLVIASFLLVAVGVPLAIAGILLSYKDYKKGMSELKEKYPKYFKNHASLMQRIWLSPATYPWRAIFWLLSKFGLFERIYHDDYTDIAFWNIPHESFLYDWFWEHYYGAAWFGENIVMLHPVPEHAFKHEVQHVKQQYKTGVFFLLCYFVAGIVAVFRGGHFYHDNWFEVDARKAEKC